MNAITKLALALGAAALLAFTASSQANDIPYGTAGFQRPRYLLDGVRIAHVVKNHPADQAGLQINDIILKVNGRRIIYTTDLDKAVKASFYVAVLTVRDACTGEIRSVEVFPRGGDIGVMIVSRFNFPPHPRREGLGE